MTTGAAAIVFEDGETPEQACVREAREETGAHVDALAGRRAVDLDELPRVS